MQPPFNFSEPNWAPLEHAVVAAGLPLDACGEWMWMCEDPAGLHHFKHRDTRKYVHLTSETSSAVAAFLIQGARNAR